jgi:hypothetical protein
MSRKEKDNDPDAGYPMVNCAYPLEYFNGDEKTIRRITRNTNCTVIYNFDEGRYYLALTGAGMDLSQDIAKAYMLAQGFIPWDMLYDVYKAGPLSVSKTWYQTILLQLRAQLVSQITINKVELDEIDRLLKGKRS